MKSKKLHYYAVVNIEYPDDAWICFTSTRRCDCEKYIREEISEPDWHDNYYDQYVIVEINIGLAF